MDSDLAKNLECFVTPQWCVDRILDVCEFKSKIWDPCCGPGVLPKTAGRRGHDTYGSDVHDWGYGEKRDQDFLQTTVADVPFNISSTTLFMNPPFSKAVDFVEHGLDLGVEHLVVFQRLAWLESMKRRQFWERRFLKTIYLCGNRATCWRVDVPEDKRGSSTTTAHAWFVFTAERVAEAKFKILYREA